MEQCLVIKARIRYAAFDRPEMSECDIQRLKWGEIISFVKEAGRLNFELTPKDDREIGVDG